MKEVQGDVILKKIDALPKGVKKLKTKILQESEVTGHHHQFKEDAAVDVYALSDLPITEQNINRVTPDFKKYIVVDNVAYLYHGKQFEYDPNPTGSGDHKAIEMPPGIYSVGIAREWNYEANEEAYVVD